MVARYFIICTFCNASFSAYEAYTEHVFKDHPDQPALRMKYKIVSS